MDTIRRFCLSPQCAGASRLLLPGDACPDCGVVVPGATDQSEPIDARARVLRLCELFADCVEAFAAHREAGTSTASTEYAMAGHVQALAELGATLPRAERARDGETP